MTLTRQELGRLLDVLQPYRAEPLSKTVVALALRIVREGR